MQCGQNVHLLNVKLLVHHVTSRLIKVKIHCHENVKSHNLACSYFLKFARHTCSYLAGNKFAVSESNGLIPFKRPFLHQSKQACGMPGFASDARSGKNKLPASSCFRGCNEK